MATVRMYLVLAIIVGAACFAVGSAIAGPIGGLVGGVVAFFLGRSIGAFGGGDTQGEAFNNQADLLCLVISAALVEAGSVSSKKLNLIREFRDEFLPRLKHSDLEAGVRAVAKEPVSPRDISAMYAGYDEPSQQLALAYSLGVLFAEGDLSSRSRQWLGEVLEGVRDVGLLVFFDRSAAIGSEESRRKWLAELGITEQEPSHEQVKRAYRAKVAMFHPDRHADQPAEFRRVLEAKVAQLSAAYQGLVSEGTTEDGRLYFQSVRLTSEVIHDSHRSSVCVCWVCGQKNRLADAARLETARCGKCSALLGLNFDPNSA